LAAVVLAIVVIACSSTGKLSGTRGVSASQSLKGKNAASGQSFDAGRDYRVSDRQLTEAEKRAYDQYFLEAMVQRQKGNQDAAFDLLSHCLDINPNAAEVYFFLAQYYTSLKENGKAVDYFQQAAKLNPENQTYAETLAQVYIQQQKFEPAITVIEQLYASDKNRVDLLEMLFQLYQQEGNFQQAIGVLERLEQIDGKNERLSQAKSEIYTRMGNRKAAVAEIEALAHQYPNDLNYMAMYGEALMMNSQPKRALDIYHHILEEEPDNNRVLMSLRTYYQAVQKPEVADSLTRRILSNKNATTQDKIQLIRQEISASENAGGDSTRVLQLFRKVLSRKQQDADMALLYATYMNLKKMPRDSIRPALEMVLDIAPDNAAARLQLVSYALQREDTTAVVELCQAGRLYNPDDLAFPYYLGLARYEQKNYDAALDAFRGGLGTINDQSDPAIVSDFYAMMAQIFHEKSLFKECYAAFDSCLQWKDDNIMALNNYAYFLSERGEQLDKAEQMSYKAIKAEPKNSTYLDTYAWILFMEKRYSEAKIYIDQALQHKDDSIDNSVILEHAGDIYIHNQSDEQAVAYWKEALETAPDNQLLIRKIKLKKYLTE